jgi:TetR/AcrR family transcriptional regulator, cholesterol catabolism regulator
MARKKTERVFDKIMAAAMRLFGTRQFHEVRMEDVADQAGVGKGTVYRYFADKDDLFIALVTHTLDRFVERMREAVVSRESPTEQLEAFVAATLAFFDAHPHFLDLIQRAEVLRRHGAEAPWLKKTRPVVVRILEEVFDRGRAQGEFQIADPELASHMLLGGLRSVIRFGVQPRPRDLSRRIVRFCLRGGSLTRGTPRRTAVLA